MIKKKMKVKSLIWTAIGLLLLIIIIIPTVNLIIAHNLRYSKPEISEKLYEVNVKYPSKFMKDESLYNLSESIMDGFGRDNIFMKARVGSKSLEYETIISAIENYEKILKDYPKSDYFVPGYKGILDSYIFLGEWSNVAKWIEWGKKNNKLEVEQMAILYDGYNHFVNRQYDEAEETLEESFIQRDDERDYIYYFLKGHIEFMKENFDKSLEYYGKASDIGWNHGTTIFGSYVPDERKHWLENLDYKNGDNIIKGRVMVEDRGIPFVPVFIQDIDSGYSTRGGNFIGITDKNGYFETIGVKDGEYDIGIGIGSHILYDKVYLEQSEYSLNLSKSIEFDFKFTSPMKVLAPSPGEVVKKDKFTVEWEEVSGADYYTIRTMSSGMGITITILGGEEGFKIKDRKITLDIESLNNQMGSSYWSDDDSPINPESILGYFHPGAERPIIIDAYDRDGNMLSSSTPGTLYYESLPSVKIENGDLSQGEKIIFSQDYERAIEYYEERLNEDSEDEEALKYLSKIHMVDWKMGKKDFDKAEDYGERYYGVTGDKTLLNRVSEYRKIYKE